MIIRASSLTKRPWKNGGGLTTEVARSGGDLFEWRLSFAEIQRDGPFSDFNGYDRWLVVWHGKGLTLNEKVIHVFEPIQFQGERVQSARLTNGSVTDLGLIYRRDKFDASMAVVTDLEDCEPGDINFIFIVEGEVTIETEILRVSDTIRFDRNSKPKARDARKLKMIFVSLIKLDQTE